MAGSSWVSPASPLGRAADRAAVQQLADARARALLHHDVDALDALAGAPTLSRRQAWLTDNLTRLRPHTWAYQVVSVEPTASTARAPTPTQKRTPSEQAFSAAAAAPSPAVGSAQARVVLRYRLRPWMAGTVTRLQQWTLRAGPRGWQLIDDGTGPGGPSEADLWDLAAIQVADGARSLVVSTAFSTAQPVRTGGMGPPARLARQADAAVRRVGQVWSQPWSRRVVLVAPATTAQLTRLVAAPGVRPDDPVDEPPDPTAAQEDRWSDVAALTVGPPPGIARLPDTDQVVLNPQAWAVLTVLGQQVVLTHEVTHVATRASANRALPGWLTEGFADYVAYRDTQLPPRVVAADALTAAAGNGPWIQCRLPSDAALDGADGQPELAYQRSWLAVRVVARRWGPARLVDWYATAAQLPPDRVPGADQAVALATRQVLGVDPGTLTQLWQQELAALVSRLPLAAAGRGR